MYLPLSPPRSVHLAPHRPLPRCLSSVLRAVRKDRLLQAQGLRLDRLALLRLPRPVHAAVLLCLGPHVREPWRIYRHGDRPLDPRSCRAQVRPLRQQLHLHVHPPRHLYSQLHPRPRRCPCPLLRLHLHPCLRLQPSPPCRRRIQTTCLPHCRETTLRGRAN